MSLKISVVLATYNRAETLIRTLGCLAQQTLDPDAFEVIVVDDGSPDDTRTVVESRITQMPFRLRYFRHDNRGPGYTQNRGIRVAEAPLILLIADDILLVPGALAAHLAMHEGVNDPSVAVLGRVAQPDHRDRTVFLQKWDPFRFYSLRGATEVPYYRFWACNISINRSFMLDHGMFVEERGKGGAASHEDVELGYRLSVAGLRILFCSEALGYHEHIVTLDAACRRGYEQGLNFPDLRARIGQPEISVVYHVISRTTLSDHLSAWFGSRRCYLPSSDRNPVVLLLHYGLRAVGFNALTVRYFWRPLTTLAEHRPAVARRMRPIFYRGIIAHHFFRGVHDAKRAETPTPIPVQT